MAQDCFARADIPAAVARLSADAVPVKKLLLWLELARQEERGEGEGEEDSPSSPTTRISLGAWQRVLARFS